MRDLWENAVFSSGLAVDLAVSRYKERDRCPKLHVWSVKFPWEFPCFLNSTKRKNWCFTRRGAKMFFRSVFAHFGGHGFIGIVPTTSPVWRAKYENHMFLLCFFLFFLTSQIIFIIFLQKRSCSCFLFFIRGLNPTDYLPGFYSVRVLCVSQRFFHKDPGHDTCCQSSPAFLQRTELGANDLYLQCFHWLDAEKNDPKKSIKMLRFTLKD